MPLPNTDLKQPGSRAVHSAPSPRAAAGTDQSAAAVAIDYCALDHVLAVACRSGDVHLLRHIHEERYELHVSLLVGVHIVVLLSPACSMMYNIGF